MSEQEQAFELPEHLTVESTRDKGFEVRVFLDGIEQKDVFEAHTGEGWLMRGRYDADGNLFTEDGETVAMERVTGVVTAEVMASA